MCIGRGGRRVEEFLRRSRIRDHGRWVDMATSYFDSYCPRILNCPEKYFRRTCSLAIDNFLESTDGWIRQ